MRRLHGCLSCAALLPPLLAVLAALAPHPAAAEAAALEGHDFLPFRAPGGCTDFLLSYNPELPYSQQLALAKLDCTKLGSGWAWSRSENSSETGALHWCRLCLPHMDECVLKWFGSQDCAEECPQPWGALAAAAAVPAWHDNGTAGAYPHLGAGCQQQMLCMVCGRKECDGCTYSWAGEAPSCQSTCEPGETLLAKDGSGDGARCAGDGAKQLCERCQQPAVFDGASVRSPKRCLQRQCGEAKPLTRFTDQPAFVAAAVRTMEGCCALCRAASGCLRFDVGPRGCAIYRTRRSSATVRSRGYTAAYNVLAHG